MTPVELHAIIEQHKHRWMGQPGVRGVGGSVCGENGWICVYVDGPDTAATIEQSVGSVRVEAVISGVVAVPAQHDPE